MQQAFEQHQMGFLAARALLAQGLGYFNKAMTQ